MSWTSHFLSFAFASTTVVVCAGCVSDIVQSASPFSEKKALCDLRPTKPQCTDIRKFQGPSLITFQQVCTSLSNASKGATGYKEDATCPTTEMLGGCRANSSGDGSEQTNWFYKSDKYKTEDDAKKECDSSQTWVGPQ